MCNGDNPKFLTTDMIDDAIGKPAKKIAAPSAAKDCPKSGVGQNQICRSLKFSHKCKSKFKICSRRIESRSIVQLRECDWKDNELHFNAART